MEVIQSGKTKKDKAVQTECIKCDCVFSFTRSEGRLVTDREGDSYIVKCPECSRENWVDASLFN